MSSAAFLATVDVVLVDDHAIVREGLRALLEREPAVRVVGEAADPDEALSVIAQQRPSVVVLDLKLSPESDVEGLRLCRQLTAERPDLGVVILTMFSDDRWVDEAMNAGARGYVLKDVDTTEIITAIRAVAAGRLVLDPRSSAALARVQGGRKPRNESLTARELDVLRLVAIGLSNRSIGRELFISRSTVCFHVQNVVRKLGAGTRAEAVYLAAKTGIL